jgi:alkylhydroperoxidase family enzyme
MHDWRSSLLFDEQDRLVLELAESLSVDHQVDDSLYGRLEEQFDRPVLVRLAMTVALAGMVNRIHATFQTEVDPRS